MKLLIVAMPESIHTARWILQLLDQGWKIWLFPSSFYEGVHPLLKARVDHRYAWARFFGASLRPGQIHVCGPLDFGIRLGAGKRPLSKLIMHLLVQILPDIQGQHLRAVIRRFGPNLIHSMEFQLAGALCAEAKSRLGIFPRWLATNWGSDIFLFSRLPWARDIVLKILKLCDVYSCECERDVRLARELGFVGKIWPVMPNSGGMDISLINSIRSQYENLPRKMIMLKGYNGWSGRAVMAIQALVRCRDLLKGYKIVLFSWTDDARIAMELASQDFGLQYETLSQHATREEVLRFHAQSRLYVGCGISDGVSTSCLEAMAMGAFPIQSNSSCCEEWFVDGKSGIAVNGEDVDQIASAIRRALESDDLCNAAREINDDIVRERLDLNRIKSNVVKQYLESVRI